MASVRGCCFRHYMAIGTLLNICGDTMKTYTVDFAFHETSYKWIVFKSLSASIKDKHQICKDKAEADGVADRLNGEENHARD